MALLTFSLLFILLEVDPAFSARIAGFCVLGGSQYINMRHTLEELASRGHEVEHNFVKLFSPIFPFRTRRSLKDD